jgi:transposase
MTRLQAKQCGLHPSRWRNSNGRRVIGLDAYFMARGKPVTGDRHLASDLGPTPREHSSGSRRRLGRISKRGEAYLWTLLIHRARSTLMHSKNLTQPDRHRTWALRLETTSRHNKAAVALAKNGAHRALLCSAAAHVNPHRGL